MCLNRQLGKALIVETNALKHRSDIMPTPVNDDYIDLETCAKKGVVPKPQNGLKVRIDDQRYKIDDPKPTGRQLLRLTGKRPVEEHLLFLILRGGGFEEIRLDETVDLCRPGIERFMTFDSSASYRLEIDGERVEWGTKLISGLKLKELAGVDPSTYAVWQEIRGGGDDLPISNEDFIDLSADGLERFFTVIEKTTAGDTVSILPRRDRTYLEERGLSFSEISENGRNGIILRNYSLPQDQYNVEKADILILLPSGYPDAPPDMFYCLPWIKIATRDGYPAAADVAFAFHSQSWQRWSRHNNQWRRGKDGIWTMLKRVDCALLSAA